MSEGWRASISWRTASWLRLPPGLRGLGVFLLLPGLFFLPLEGVGLFEERPRGVSVIIWLSALAVALNLRGGRPLRDPSAIWLLQKGIPLPEVALRDCILDGGLFLCVSLWWATVGALGLGLVGHGGFGVWAGLLAMGFGTALLAHLLTLVFSAFGVERPSDPTVLLAILALLSPALTMRAPEWVQEWIPLLLPPFRSPILISNGLAGGAPGAALDPLLHLVLISGALLALGLWRHGRWRPPG